MSTDVLQHLNPLQAEQSRRSRSTLDNVAVLATALLLYGLVTVLLEHGMWLAFTSGRHVSRLRGIGLVAAPMFALPLCVLIAPHTLERVRAKASGLMDSHGLLIWASMVLAALVLPILIARFVLDRFPNSGDEYAYLFQAEQFARGHLWAKAPPLGDTFVAFRTWIIGDKWLSQYPPGWPMLLALGLLAGIPAWSINAVLGAAGVAALGARSWGFSNRALALTVFALYVLSGFYLFNSASYFSHTWAALLVLLVCLCCLWYEREGRVIALIACGALLGLLGLTRYFSLALLLPALAWWVFIETKRHRLRIIGTVMLCGSPFLAALLLYQYLVTGNPFHSTYALITTNDVFLSFKPKDVATGAALTWVRFGELSVWAFPLVLPVYLLCLIRKIRNRSLAFYDLVFPCFVLGYVFFADLGGNRYGPRYYFDAFPLMLVTIVSAARAPDPEARPGTVRKWAIGAALLSAVYVAAVVPFVCNAFRKQVIQREEPYRLAAERGLDGAIIIIQTPSGHDLDPSDLARNDIRLQSRVLYARPGSSVADLHRWAPERSIWRYWGQSGGRLEPALPP